VQDIDINFNTLIFAIRNVYISKCIFDNIRKVYISKMLTIKQKEGVKMNGTKTKDANKEERITLHNSIAENIANGVKEGLNRHASEGKTTEVKIFEHNADTDKYVFSISSREKDSASVEDNFGRLNVTFIGDNSIKVVLKFDNRGMPLNKFWTPPMYSPNLPYSYLALDLGDTIKEKVDGFETAIIDISTYDGDMNNPIKEGSYYYKRHKNNKTGIRQ